MTGEGSGGEPAAGQGVEGSEGVEVVILEARAVDGIVGKVRAASAAAPVPQRAVNPWRAGARRGGWRQAGHDHAVVGATLMYLHDAPDGMLVPHARYPDGTEKVYTDALHAGSVF